MAELREFETEALFSRSDNELDELREEVGDAGIALHGSSLNLGSPDPLDFEDLKRLRRLVERLQPVEVSDHIAMSAMLDRSLFAPLPLVPTRHVVDHVVSRTRVVSEVLERDVLLENVACAWGEPHGAEMAEGEFLRAVLEGSGAKLLLHVNSLMESARLQGVALQCALDSLRGVELGAMHVDVDVAEGDAALHQALALTRETLGLGPELSVRADPRVHVR